MEALTLTELLYSECFCVVDFVNSRMPFWRASTLAGLVCALRQILVDARTNTTVMR